jgi:hypothetical protein
MTPKIDRVVSRPTGETREDSPHNGRMRDRDLTINPRLFRVMWRISIQQAGLRAAILY